MKNNRYKEYNCRDPVVSKVQKLGRRRNGKADHEHRRNWVLRKS